MSPTGWLFRTSTVWSFHRSPVHQVILGLEMQVDTSQVQWAPCSALKCYLESPSVCVWARDSFICAVLSPGRKQKCHAGRNHICTANGDKGAQLVPGACGIVGVKNLQSEISGPKGASGPSQTPWKSWAWRSRNSCSHGAALHVSPAPALGESEAGSRPVRSGRVSLMDSLLFHITLFARDHWKYFRNAQNNAMGLFRLCNPGPQKSLVFWYVLGFENVWRQRRLDTGCNLKHTRSKDIPMDLEQNTCHVVSMLCFTEMPRHHQNCVWRQDPVTTPCPFWNDALQWREILLQ